ncbi:MAG: superoxide dismutase [Ni] [Gemmataceae bacterium]
MLRTYAKITAFVCLLAIPTLVAAHCQVPCGIYADQRRFEAMLEDQKTIAKAINQMAMLSEKKDPQSFNQAVRWVVTKDEHASNTQKIIAEYFMSQRLKPDDKKYVMKLTAAHGVMRAAMVCKQKASPKAAAALKMAIFKFYEAYEGKKPTFHDH